MRSVIGLVAVVSIAAIVAGVEVRGTAAEQTWSAIVSDSACRDDHGGEVDPRECVQKCIGNGEKYVLMVDGYTKVLPIANQDFPALPGHAGQTVKATGELRDGAVVLTGLQ
ncbi:MAG: hypothetical protein QM736_20925 [Vicinamibacterales bacterium]